MGTRTEVVLACDLCGTEDMVETHEVTVDGVMREGEACLTCWAGVVKLLDPFYRAGREPETPKRRARKVSRQVVEWPGTHWRFTAHALERLGQRFLDPVAVLQVIERPKTTYPGLTDGLEVRVGRGGLKVVVNPDQQTIITASNEDEEVEEVT